MKGIILGSRLILTLVFVFTAFFAKSEKLEIDIPDGVLHPDAEISVLFVWSERGKRFKDIDIWYTGIDLESERSVSNNKGDFLTFSRDVQKELKSIGLNATHFNAYYEIDSHASIKRQVNINEGVKNAQST